MSMMKRFLIPVLALLLAGCAVRIDTPDPTPEPPSQAEIVRQREVLRAEVFAGIGFGEGAAVATHAQIQLDALGGVWEAWPDGDGPTDAETPEGADIATPPGPTELSAALVQTTPDLVEAAIDADNAVSSSLYASIAVARTADEVALALAQGQPGSPSWPDSALTALPEVIRALDAAAYGLDILAAQDSAAGLETTAQADAERFRRWADASALELGIAGTDQDPREPLYSVETIERGRIYADLAEVLVTAVPPSADRGAVLAAAQACANAATLHGATVGPLPGLALPRSG